MTEQEKNEILNELEARFDKKYKGCLTKEDTQSILKEPRNKWFRDTQGSCSFTEGVQENFSSGKYDVNTQMISPILSSIINGEYTFVIMGDCSKLGWETSEIFEKYREEWISQNKEIVQNILVVDFGEGGLDAFVTEY